LNKKPLVNNQIRSREVRVIDETGQQLGVINLGDALQKSRERNLDLIQVTEKIEPPVCKIMDYGKYLYQQKKKEKGVKPRGGEIKGIRLSFNISEHDMETRARQAEKFLKEGDKVRIEVRLRGREKALGDHAKKKVSKFLEILQSLIPYKAERELKREPRGLSMIISKQ
jgi:translation initiation factor IF-3